jgi:isoamylase
MVEIVKTNIGKPYPLGATWSQKGVNFSIYSESTTGVDLCLFSESGQEVERLPLQEVTGFVWHAFVPGIQPGQLYGYRAQGPFDPNSGLRFNPAKLLIDPYAKALSGKLSWNAPVFPYKIGHQEGDLAPSYENDAWGMPKCVVVDPVFDWEGDHRLEIPWHQSIIYEVHVKGFTIRHPELPENIRGTYAGLASPLMINYLKDLGITAVELMPIHEMLDDKFLIDKGLKNYWGYNTINYFSPTARYSSSGDTGGQLREFKEMVKALHKAGIEVILDVVYNHTSEGNHLGPMLGYKGIDNTTYYRLVWGQPRYYMDYTGTGNSLNVRHPEVLQLIMDSLRYWVLDMHVDGFRFDLAATLARELHEVDRLSAFFDIIQQDPVISQVKLIAEPWDVGPGGYQVGNFPTLWTEWNGKYRDAIRRFCRGDDGLVSEIGYRLSGSSDLYQRTGRRPYASINYVTSHDGFTLHDLVSYNYKHNEANGEENRDGTNDNLSWNCGAEGPTDNLQIIELRERQKRNFLATLLLSQGVPMICGGDEIGRTQQGNNNAYCQDNEITWFDWNLDERKQSLLGFVSGLIKVRRKHPVLHRRHFFQGRPIRGPRIKDIMWLRPDGQEMTDKDWNAGWIKCISLYLDGESTDEFDQDGNLVIDDTLLLIFNYSIESITFFLPLAKPEEKWELILDTTLPQIPPVKHLIEEPFIEVAGRSTYLLGYAVSQRPLQPPKENPTENLK